MGLRLVAVGVVLAAAGGVLACSGPAAVPAGSAPSSARSSDPTASASTGATATRATTRPAPRPTATSTARRSVAPSRSATRPASGRPGRSPDAQLPGGGWQILPRYRVVAYYGAADTPALGVLGEGTPDQAAAAIDAQAAAYARFGRPVQPAMELLATVAQRSPGPDGLYSAAVPDADIAAYLAAAHRHRMLLILDIQPGRGEFLPQVRQLAPFLGDPSVSIALDPEWKVSAGEVPGTVIGSASAASINAVADYLSNLVTARRLPDKLLVVHEFTASMLPDRSAIARPPGLEVVLHADGHADPGAKIDVYHRLAIPAPPYYAGFKLFYRQDQPMMSPAQVMALRPQPNVITYE